MVSSLPCHLTLSVTPQVRNTILEFVPVLIKHDYLVRHQGNELLLQLIRLTFTEYSVRQGQGKGPEGGTREGAGWGQHTGKQGRGVLVSLRFPFPLAGPNEPTGEVFETPYDGTVIT